MHTPSRHFTYVVLAATLSLTACGGGELSPGTDTDGQGTGGSGGSSGAGGTNAGGNAGGAGSGGAGPNASSRCPACASYSSCPTATSSIWACSRSTGPSAPSAFSPYPNRARSGPACPAGRSRRRGHRCVTVRRRETRQRGARAKGDRECRSPNDFAAKAMPCPEGARRPRDVDRAMCSGGARRPQPIARPLPQGVRRPRAKARLCPGALDDLSP